MSPTNPSDIDAFLAEYPEGVRATVERLRDAVRAALPQARERLQSGYRNLTYGAGQYGAGAMGIAYIAPFKDSVNIGFMRGSELPDPRGLLQGTGKQMRHIKLRSPEDVARLERPIASLLTVSAALGTIEQ